MRSSEKKENIADTYRTPLQMIINYKSNYTYLALANSNILETRVAPDLTSVANSL